MERGSGAKFSLRYLSLRQKSEIFDTSLVRGRYTGCCVTSGCALCFFVVRQLVTGWCKIPNAYGDMGVVVHI